MSPTHPDNVRALLIERGQLRADLEDARAELERLRLALFKLRLQRTGTNQYVRALAGSAP